MSVVYKHTCLVTGKSYIGWSKNWVRRLDQHAGSKSLFGKALRKHGLGSFVTELLFVGTSKECMEFERSAIHEHNTMCPGGYNLCAGGNGLTPEDSRRIHDRPEVKKRLRECGNRRENIEGLVAHNKSQRMRELHRELGSTEENKQRLRDLSRSPEGRHRARVASLAKSEKYGFPQLLVLKIFRQSKRPRTIRDVARQLGFPDARVRRAVTHLRKKGYNIVRVGPPPIRGRPAHYMLKK